jgi:hypothetical protein
MWCYGNVGEGFIPSRCSVSGAPQRWCGDQPRPLKEKNKPFQSEQIFGNRYSVGAIKVICLPEGNCLFRLPLLVVHPEQGPKLYILFLASVEPNGRVSMSTLLEINPIQNSRSL